MKTLIALMLFAFLLAPLATPSQGASPEQPAAAADGSKPSADKPIAPPAALNTDKIGQVLLVFLVLSIVFETALTPLFSWRFFLARFEGKGYKVPITVIFAFIVFWSYDLDIIRDLLVAMGHDKVSLTKGGQILTALLIAGGSDGIFRIFTKLGIRNPAETKQRAQDARAELAASTKSKLDDK